MPAAVSCSNESVRRIAWPMLIWPWIWLVQSGEFESSKSVMYESAPELKALMTILASTGPVISTRRRCSAGGTGAIFQSPARIAGGGGEEVGPLAGVDPPGALGARREQLLAPRLEGAVQLGDERERGLGQDGLEAGQDRRVDLHAGRQGEASWGRSLGWEEGEDVVEVAADPGRLGAELVERQAEAVDPERRVAEPGRADRVPAVARDEQDVAGGKAERLRAERVGRRDRS